MGESAVTVATRLADLQDDAARFHVDGLEQFAIGKPDQLARRQHVARMLGEARRPHFRSARPA